MSELRLTVGWLAAAIAGRIVSGDPEQVVGNVVTDSRSLQVGDFFVALKGPRFDGHVFVFRGRRGDIIKVLWFDGQGLCLFANQLCSYCILSGWMRGL